MKGNENPVLSRLWAYAIWAVVIFFVLNLLAMIATVVVNSLSTRWLGTWLPPGFTTRWYFSAWKEFQLDDVLLVTFQIAGAVALLSALLGVPAAYALARRDFPGKKLVMLLFLLPLLVPPFTYGIPLATVLYKSGLAGTMWGVIVANLVPTVPFVVLVLIPFIEQIDPRVEAAARVFGAGTVRLFVYVLVPAADARHPGRRPAGADAHHGRLRADLPHLRSRPARRSSSRSITPSPPPACEPDNPIDAMAVIYMLTTLVWLLVALRFVNPTQIVARAKQTH